MALMQKESEVISRMEANEASPNKAYLHYLSDITKYNVEVPLYDIFNIQHRSEYKSVPIDALGLTVRSSNCLMRGKRTSLDLLFGSCIRELFNIRNMGKTSLLDIIACCERFAKDSKKYLDLSKVAKPHRIDDILGFKADIPLYEILKISYRDEYANTSIDVLGLTVRSYNCLKYNNLETLDLLFGSCLEKLSKIRNMGITSLLNIVDACARYSKEYSEFRSVSPTNSYELIDSAIREENNKSKRSEILQEIAKCIATNVEYDVSALTASDMKFVDELHKAFETLGEELYISALAGSAQVKTICNMLDAYYEKQKLFSDIQVLLHKCEKGLFIKALHILPFIYVYSKNNTTKLKEVFTKEDRFSDLDIYMEQYYESPSREKEEFFADLRKLLQWISLGIDIAIDKVFAESEINERTEIVMQLREEGNTLAEVGELVGLTRERVRQIEAKYCRLFKKRYENARLDILGMIYAFRNGDAMITREELIPYLSVKRTNRVWYLLSNHVLDESFYKYSSDYDAILFESAMGKNTELSNEIVNAFPEFVLEEDMYLLVKQAIEEHGLWEKKIWLDVNRRYYKSERAYSTKRLTVLFICDYVLQHYFPNGYKISDSYEAGRFRKYIVEIFGESKSHITDRAIDAKIGEVGILCDRGKYIHPSRLTVGSALIESIYHYIEESPRSALSYKELYDSFKIQLAGTQVTNHYYLQGVLKHYGRILQPRYSFYHNRDYVAKEEDVTLTDDFNSFIAERGIVHKSEIFSEFSGLYDATLAQIVSRCPMIFNIDDGYYIHASLFNIHEDDYTVIRNYLIGVCAEYPVNIRSVYDDLSILSPEFIERNDMHNRNKLFAILCFMFADEFTFSKPYIAKLTEQEITNRSVILQLINDYDNISIDELIEICRERNINVLSTTYLIQQLAPHYFRYNVDEFIKQELTGIDDDVINEAADILKQIVNSHDFLASSRVEDFIWYPTIDVDWNVYLLESIVLSSGGVNYILYPNTRSDRLNAVYVSEKYKHENFQSFVVMLLTEELKRGSFSRKNDMHQWLKDKGLIDGKLPNYIESSQYFYEDNDGMLRRRQEDQK